MPDIPHPPVIALMTDMGLADWYVGTMKGVGLSICPEVQYVDITHHLTTQSVQDAAFVLNVSHGYFPAGAIFICVVDPGVGSERKMLVARSEKYYFVAPDNGILTFASTHARQWETRAIENPAYRLKDPSQTFHGRDIFMPAAAHLAAGAPFESFGPCLDSIQLLPFVDDVQRKEHGLLGRILYIDNFGNLLTNVTPDLVDPSVEPSRYRFRFNSHAIHGIAPHFAAVPLNHPLMYWGSSGLLEIAFNQGSIARRWNVRVGEWFDLEWI